MITQEQIDKLRELDKAATPGPWTYDGMHSEIHAYESANGAFLIVSELREHPGDEIPDEYGHAYNPNFELITAMRNALPGLLDAFEDRRHALSAMREARDSAVEENVSLRRTLAELADEISRIRAERDARAGIASSREPP